MHYDFCEKSLKAQVSVISVLLVVGIGTALAATAYMWGMPMIEKRSTLADYNMMLDFMNTLDESIITIANQMSGENTINIPKGMLTIIPYPEGADSNPNNNTIIIQFLEPQPMVLDGSVYVDTEVLGTVATYGEAEPRTLSLSGEEKGGSHEFTFSMRYRELDTKTLPERGYQIRLNPVSSTGMNRITVSFGGTETITGGAKNGGDLIITYVNLLAE